MSVTTLTKRLVTTAQPKDRAYELRDTQVRGLLLRVQPSGHTAWVASPGSTGSVVRWGLLGA